MSESKNVIPKTLKLKSTAVWNGRPKYMQLTMDTILVVVAVICNLTLCNVTELLSVQCSAS